MQERIHKYQNNGYNIVLDIESGSVHVVDELTYDVLDTFPEESEEEVVRRLGQTYQEEEIREACREIRELMKEGSLFTPLSKEAVDQALMQKKPVVKALCLHIAHDCNLACEYCFAGKGDYAGERGLMSEEVGKAALDFLVKSSGNRKNLEVDFFGGEPTLNLSAVKALVAYGRELEKTNDKHFRFTLTTNGLLLDEDLMNFVNAEMDNVVLSIDGRKEIHDRMRPDRGGRGSYDRILPGFQKLAESRGQERYYVRGTFTRNNLDFSGDVLHLADLGFKQISLEPVVAPASAPYALREEDLPCLMEEYDKLAHEMAERIGTEKEFNFFHFMIDLEGGPCIVKRMSGCGAGGEYLAVTPKGELYPCHQFVSNPDFLLGNLKDGVVRSDLTEEFSKVNVFSKEECSRCFARYYCSGGCAANAFHFNGNINSTYNIGCELERKRVECAIMLQAVRADLEEK